MAIMIKMKQIVVIKKTIKQVMVVMIVMIIMIKDNYKVKGKIIITNDNKENNDKDYISESNNE